MVDKILSKAKLQTLYVLNAKFGICFEVANGKITRARRDK